MIYQEMYLGKKSTTTEWKCSYSVFCLYHQHEFRADMCFVGLSQRQCMFMSLHKAVQGVGVLLGKAFVRVHESAHVCASAHYTWLFFPHQALCSTFHDLQHCEPSSIAVFTERVWKEQSLGIFGTPRWTGHSKMLCVFPRLSCLLFSSPAHQLKERGVKQVLKSHMLHFKLFH